MRGELTRKQEEGSMNTKSIESKRPRRVLKSLVPLSADGRAVVALARRLLAKAAGVQVSDVRILIQYGGCEQHLRSSNRP